MQTTLGIFNGCDLVCWAQVRICNTEAIINMINVQVTLVCGENT